MQIIFTVLPFNMVAVQNLYCPNLCPPVENVFTIYACYIKSLTSLILSSTLTCTLVFWVQN